MILNHTSLLNFASPCLFSPLAAMATRSASPSGLPTWKAKPRGEVAQFPILENEEGSGAVYWNPRSPPRGLFL